MRNGRNRYITIYLREKEKKRREKRYNMFAINATVNR